MALPKSMPENSPKASRPILPGANGMLDNPIWYALTNQQAGLALGEGRARRYPYDVGPFGAVAANDAESFAQIATLIPSGGTVGLMNGHPPLESGWELLRELTLFQMVYDGPTVAAIDGDFTLLTPDNVPEMLKLVEQTHPGPFLPRTIELGDYWSIQQDGQIAAMAGTRFHLPGYREISAVCAHPDYQRRGYARQLLLHLIGEIQRDGETPFLHVFHENASAIRLYESLGFKTRALLTLYVLKRL